LTEPAPLRLANGEPFATGAATFFDAYPGARERQPRLYVAFQPEGLSFSLLALLDTGAHYCILNEDAARLLEGRLTDGLGEVTIRTAHGLVRGQLFLHRLRLLASVGESLDVEAIVFVPPGWRAPCFLGYTGFLDRIRFALDPSTSRFFFGPLGP
jgi:hypothetical protein